MVYYTIQVSNHSGVKEAVPSQEAIDSWKTVHAGPIESTIAAKETVHKLSKWYKYVRSFKGGNNSALGKLFYFILK